MKYKELNPIWHNYNGVSILTGTQDQLLGYIKPIGNQIHLEYIRRLKKENRRL